MITAKIKFSRFSPRRISHMLSVFMAAVVLACFFGSCFAFAADAPEKVRIGYSLTESNVDINDPDYKTGWKYEYYQNIAYRVGWEYEYIYGNFSELMKMLEKGDIDILGNVSYTEERAEKMLFSDYIMGQEYYYIYCKKGSEELDSGVISSLKGKSVGVTVNTYQEKLLREWNVENGLELEIHTYPNETEVRAALERGETETVAFARNKAVAGYVAAYSFGSSGSYFAVTKSRPDLLEKVNNAMYSILNQDPLYNVRIRVKYSQNLSDNTTLSQTEKSWAEAHPIINIGYYNYFMPFSEKDNNGELKGVLPQLMQKIAEGVELDGKISFVYKCYDNSEEVVRALENGEIDAAFPMVGDYYFAEKYGMMISTEIMTTSLALVYNPREKAGLNGTYKKIAVPKNNMVQANYTERLYPGSQSVFYDTLYDCFEAVRDGEADGMLMLMTRAQYYLSTEKFKNLAIVECAENSRLCFLTENHNRELLGILNKGITSLGSTFVFTLLNESALETGTKSFAEFVREHFAVIIISVIALAAIIICFAAYYVYKVKKVNQALVAANVEVQRAKEAADRSNEAKTKFLFNMSHDIRTPMNAILGYAEILEKHRDNEEKFSNSIRRIKSSGRYMLELVNKVLEMSRMETSEIQLEEVPWSMEQFSDYVFSMFADVIERKSIKFTQTYNIEHKCIYCDPVRIKELYANIISNSLKYTPDGGFVNLTITEIPCEKEGYVTFKAVVEDNGIGISEEYLPHIYETFTREQSTTESRVSGTGLGMSITKRLVDAMGGEITVESHKNEGTRVTVVMSHRISDESVLDYVKENTPDENYDILRGKRVLLAEDNDINAEIMIEILSEAGIKAEIAVNGLECVEMMEKAEPGYYRAILMDIQMPVMNGYDAARAIRSLKDKEKANIPIFAVTANAFREDIQDALNAGMNGHISKPIDIKTLYRILSVTFKNG